MARRGRDPQTRAQPSTVRPTASQKRPWGELVAKRAERLARWAGRPPGQHADPRQHIEQHQHRQHAQPGQGPVRRPAVLATELTLRLADQLVEVRLFLDQPVLLAKLELSNSIVGLFRSWRQIGSLIFWAASGGISV